ncbi:hypothetical protein Q7P37_002501 [Cladosporium fusiforme]
MAKSKHGCSPSKKKKKSSTHQTDHDDRSIDQVAVSPSKRKAEGKSPNADHGNKRPARSGGQAATAHDAATFKRQFAADFHGMPIKEEPNDDAAPAPTFSSIGKSPLSDVPNCKSSPPANPATAVAGGDIQVAGLAHKNFKPEEVLISIILRQPFAEQLARVGIEQFIQEGHGAAGLGIESSIARVQDFVAQLDRIGIPDDIRAHVVGMLQQNLRDSCNDLNARIGDLGASSAPVSQKADLNPTADPDDGNSDTIAVAKQSGSQAPKIQSSSNPDSATPIPREKLQKFHLAQSDFTSSVSDDGYDPELSNLLGSIRGSSAQLERHSSHAHESPSLQSQPAEKTRSDTPQSTPGESGAMPPSSARRRTRASQSRCVDVPPNDNKATREHHDNDREESEGSAADDNSEYIEGAENVLSNWKKPSIPATPAAKKASRAKQTINTIQQYGVPTVKWTFDIFARCAITACSFAPRDDDDPIEIRRHAHKTWHKIDYSQKSEWEKLFVCRSDANANIFTKGYQLLESNQLLPLVIPHFETRAWITGISRSRTQESLSGLQIAPHRHEPQKSASSAHQSQHVVPSSPASIASQTGTDHSKPSSSTAIVSSSSSSSSSNKPTESKFFPMMMQANPNSHKIQASFVPFVRRPGHSDQNMMFIFNTPDAYTGAEVTEDDLREAFDLLDLEGFVDVARCNYNTFFATFTNPELGKQARDLAVIRLPSVMHPSSTLEFRSEYWRSVSPRVFIWRQTHASVDLNTVSERICSALRCPPGPHAGPSFVLLLQENLYPPGGRKNYPAYTFLLRFLWTAPNPNMERFYFPLDSMDDDSTIWAFFRPYVLHDPCSLCRQYCQIGKESTCPFAKMLGNSSSRVENFFPSNGGNSRSG